MLVKASVVVRDVWDSLRDVVVEGIGSGACVARNIWYVWRLARIKRQARGITGRPSRFVRF